MFSVQSILECKPPLHGVELQNCGAHHDKCYFLELQSRSPIVGRSSSSHSAWIVVSTNSFQTSPEREVQNKTYLAYLPH